MSLILFASWQSISPKLNDRALLVLQMNTNADLLGLSKRCSLHWKFLGEGRWAGACT